MTFLWKPPVCPNDSKPLVDIQNNKMLFTADKEGNYEIILTIESNNKSIYEETFLLHANKSTSSINNLDILLKGNNSYNGKKGRNLGLIIEKSYNIQ